MQVEAVGFQCNTSSGLQTITAPGLGAVVPKAVLFVGVGADAVNDSDAHSKLTWGAADGTRQWAHGGNGADGQGTTQTGTISRTNKCLAFTTDAGSTPAVDGEAEFDAFVAGGVRIDWTNAVSDNYHVVAIFFAGDDVSAYAGNVTLGAEDVEVDVTAPGFRPGVLIAACPGQGSSTVANHYRLSLGAAVDNGAGFDQRCWYYQFYDNVGTSRTQGLIRDDRIGGRGDNTYSVEVTTPDASGFSVFARGGSPTSDAFFYLAIKSDDQAEVFTHQPATGTGNQANTGIGFLPHTLLMGLSSHSAINTLQGNGSTLCNSHSVTVIKSGFEETLKVEDEDGLGTSNNNSRWEAVAQALFDPDGGTNLYVGTLVSFDSDGFTFNYSDGSGSPARYSWGLAFGPVAPVADDDYGLALLGVGE